MLKTKKTEVPYELLGDYVKNSLQETLTAHARCEQAITWKNFKMGLNALETRPLQIEYTDWDI